MLRAGAVWRLSSSLIRNYSQPLIRHASLRQFSANAHRQAEVNRPPSQLQLRDYQEECIQAVVSSLENGHKRLGISLATGAGKTVIFTQLIDRIKPSPGNANQTLILAHRRELVEQAARHCTNAYPDKSVDIEMGNVHATGTADITVASVQSITSGIRINKFDPQRFKLVLVDEAHHIVAPGYLRALEHFGLEQKRETSPALVGVSATFSRFDGLRLGAAIDETVYHKDYIDMIGEKWLSNVIFTTVESKADLSKVRSGATGDFQSGELSRVVNTEQVNEITVRSWLAKAAGRKSTLVFCVDLSHVAGLTQSFRNHGIDARFVTGDTPKAERSERLEAFKAGGFPVLINCGVFTEGTDIPNIDCVILARPTRSRNLLVQMIGRGMRLHQGKANCHVIDMVSSLEAGIITTPTLFGLDPGELVNGASVDEMRKLKDGKEAEEKRTDIAHSAKPVVADGGLIRSITFTEYDSVFDLISDTSGEKHIRSISQYAWVQTGPEKYILSAPSGTYIRLERDENGEDNRPMFAAWEIKVLPQGVASKSPYATPRRLLEATTFADAVHGADKYASEKFPNNFIARRMRWRSGPATEGQLKFINKVREKGDQLAPTDITMGKASDMITKVKHGARGRFATLDADRRRKERRASHVEQESERKLREKVTVGPVMA